MGRLGSCLVLTLVATSCRRNEPTIPVDFITPEGAILKLEQAYLAKDLEAAVAAKGFCIEAWLMLKGKWGEAGRAPENIQEIADTLELAYRAELLRDGFPDSDGVDSTFPNVSPYENEGDVVVVTERCRFPDGGYSVQNLLVGKTKDGWRVLNPLY